MLFQGLSPALAATLPAGALLFGSYEGCKALWEGAESKLQLAGAERGSSGPPSFSALQLKELLCGGLSGSAVKLALYPLDTVKRRLQVAGLQRPATLGPPLPPYASAASALLSIGRQEGWAAAGLYKGAAPALLKSGASAALTFWGMAVFSAAARALLQPEGGGRSGG
jgi:solute carrier family 25 thiamine pyrophosphate transporter 19